MQHRIQLDLEIDFSSRWHAGSGEGSLAIDRLIRKDAFERPFIPASTLKGIIRQSCEKLSRTRGFKEPSDPHQSDLTENQSFVPFEQIASPIDRLFGTKYEAGGLFFRDARLQDDEEIKTVARNRTARYRVLQTAKDQQLFSSEYAPAAKFFTTIDGWHKGLTIFDDDYPPFAYCLLIAGILAVERIGGDKSTGAGWLDGKIEIKSATVNGASVDLDDIFEFLEPQDYIDMRGEA